MSLIERAVADYDAGMADSYWDGVEAEKLEIARKMLAENDPIDKIQRVTGLDEDDIKALQDEME